MNNFDSKSDLRCDLYEYVIIYSYFFDLSEIIPYFYYVIS